MEGGDLDVGLLHGQAEICAVVQDQGGLGGQIVEQTAGLGVEIGQIPLDAPEALAGAQGFQLVANLLFDTQDQIGGGQKLHQFVIFAGQCPGTVLGQGLAARPDLQPLHPADRALGGRVEDAQAVHLVAEEVDAHRLGQIGRPDVDDSAPAGEGARLFDHFDRVVAALHPAGGEALQIDNIPHGDGAQGHAQLFGGQGLVHQGASRGDDQGGRAIGRALQGGQGGQAPLHGHIRPVDALVGQGFGCGEEVDQGRLAQFRVTGGQELGDLLGQLKGPLRLVGDEQGRAGAVGGQSGSHQGARRSEDGLGREVQVFVHGAQQVRVGGDLLEYFQ